MRSSVRLLSAVFAIVWSIISGYAQDGVPEDNVFRLVQAERAQQVTEYGMSYRRVTGNARFLHNNTYFVCDSASWNVDAKVIQAFGNVQVIQDNTMLQSEEMTYLIDRNLARFSGPLVELFDKTGNILRTNQLEYNTQDSVAVFDRGGAMRDTSGNVMESQHGMYDAKAKTFTFDGETELYMDSIKIKSMSITYLSDYSKAVFGKDTYMWRGDGFLHCNGGSYDRNTSVVRFADDVYMNDPQYEAWSDEVIYDQVSGVVEMFKNSQILDTLHKSTYFAHRLLYEPSPTDTTEHWVDRVTLTEDPAIVYCGENENKQPDTLYVAADSMSVYVLHKFNVPEEEIADGEKRRSDLEYDALAKSREEMAAQREEERKRKMQEAGLLPPDSLLNKNTPAVDSIAQPDIDSLAVPVADSVAVPALDSLAAPAADSLQTAAVDTIPHIDSTLVRYVRAFRNARAFRSDVQARCDSMFFSQVDSIAKLYGEPVLWNAVKNQLTANEMQLMLKDGNLYRGSMVTDAWVISQEDSIHFHQIKSTEMLGYFYDNQLYRYDALGGVNAVFYLAEEEVVTTINVKESKSLTAMIKNGNARRLLYVESIKSDAYPVGDLSIEKQRMKGFNWRGEERPERKEDITTREMNSTDREKFIHVRKPRYQYTKRYFEDFTL